MIDLLRSSGKQLHTHVLRAVRWPNQGERGSWTKWHQPQDDGTTLCGSLVGHGAQYADRQVECERCVRMMSEAVTREVDYR